MRATAPVTLAVATAVVLFGACGDSDPQSGITPLAGSSGSAGAASTGSGGTGGFPIDSGGTGGTDASFDAPQDGPAPDGAGLDPDEQWVADATLWQPVPDMQVFKNCIVRETKANVSVPALNWASCGSGCEVADPIRLGNSGRMPAASIVYVDGVPAPFAALNESEEADGWIYAARRLIALKSGETVGAVAQMYESDLVVVPCAIGRDGESARFSTILGLEHARYFAFDPNGGVLWSPAVLHAEVPFSGISLDLDEPAPRLISGSGTLFTFDFSGSGWTEFVQAEPAYSGMGVGELALWVRPENGGVQTLRGWKDDGNGVVTLAPAVPTRTCRIGLSSTMIVGLASDLASYDCVNPQELRLWRATRVEPATIVTSPALTIPFHEPGGGLALRTWGDYAALFALVYDGSAKPPITFPLYLIQLSTWKMWRIDARPGFAWSANAFVLDETHLYAMERPVDSGMTLGTLDVATSFVRLELESIDQLALAKPVQ